MTVSVRQPRALSYAWLLVALLWVVALLNYLDRQIIFAVLPLLRLDLKLTDVQLALLSTVFLWVYGFLSPAAGYLADRFGPRRVILGGLLIWSLVTWGTGLARGARDLLLARGIMGVSEACYLPAGLALIASVHGERTRSLATGLQFSGLYVGIIIGGFGGGWMGDHYGWRTSFWILGVFGVGYALFLRYALIRSSEPRPAAAGVGFFAALAELVRLPNFLTLTLIFSGMAIANWLVYTWLPLYLFEQFHISLAHAGFTATFYNQAGCMGGMLAGGWLADRWSRRNSRARLLTQAVALAIAAPALALVGWAASELVLAISLVFFGFGRAMYDCNAMPSVCQIARPEVRSTGYGIFNGAGCIAGGVMALGAGWVKASVGLATSFYIAGAILLVSALMLLFVTAPTAVVSLPNAAAVNEPV
jgi:MFS family permease